MSCSETVKQSKFCAQVELKTPYFPGWLRDYIEVAFEDFAALDVKIIQKTRFSITLKWNNSTSEKEIFSNLVANVKIFGFEQMIQVQQMIKGPQKLVR